MLRKESLEDKFNPTSPLNVQTFLSHCVMQLCNHLVSSSLIPFSLKIEDSIKICERKFWDLTQEQICSEQDAFESIVIAWKPSEQQTYFGIIGLSTKLRRISHDVIDKLFLRINQIKPRRI